MDKLYWTFLVVFGCCITIGLVSAGCDDTAVINPCAIGATAASSGGNAQNGKVGSPPPAPTGTADPRATEQDIYINLNCDVTKGEETPGTDGEGGAGGGCANDRACVSGDECVVAHCVDGGCTLADAPAVDTKCASGLGFCVKGDCVAPCVGMPDGAACAVCDLVGTCEAQVCKQTQAGPPNCD